MAQFPTRKNSPEAREAAIRARQARKAERLTSHAVTKAVLSMAGAK